MLSNLFSKDYFDDRPLFVLSGLAVFSMLVTVFRVLTTVQQYDYRIAVGYTQYGADSFKLGEWYTLYEFAVFAVISTIAAIFISAKVFKIGRQLAYGTIVLQHVVLLFLFLVSNALLSASSIAS